MIRMVVRVGLLRMWHGRTEILLSFVVPIAFFTIFAFIFDEQIGLGKSPKVNVAFVDEDRSALSGRLLEELGAQDVLRVLRPEAGDALAFDAEAPVRELVASGGLPLAVVVPEGWAASLESGEPAKDIRVLADSADPVATQVASALIQQVAGQLLAARARERVQSILVPGEPAPDGAGPGVSPAQLAALATLRLTRPVTVDVVDLLAADKASPVVSMYASGIAVMFLLFGAVGNAGSLQEERETQTLERLMCSQLGMNRLLVGKWVLMLLVGVAQVTVMFAWAQVAFGVDLTGHVPGFLVMTVVTAGAAGSFALVLATLCRTRVQLNAVAIVLILTMSALGGSMVPRYVMSESMQEFGKITFNAWALDGYTKVFWRDLPVSELGAEVTVLVVVAVVLFGAARLLARRWESV